MGSLGSLTQIATQMVKQVGIMHEVGALGEGIKVPCSSSSAASLKRRATDNPYTCPDFPVTKIAMK